MMNILKDLYSNNIPSNMSWTSITPITSGWSHDIKFKIETDKEEIYLLRLTDIKHYQKKLEDYESLLPLRDLKLNISMPIEFGKCVYQDQEYCYTILSWIDGENAKEIIANLSVEKQNELGHQAGEILKQIHSIPISAKYKDMCWETYFNKKLDRNILLSKECPVKFKGKELLIQYINDNRTLLKGRPISFHHGDYHLGNMLIDKECNLGVIDFNRQDHGDPWEEFNRITWCCKKNPHFASARIKSYFNNKVPDEFFKLMALYIASNQLSSIPWAIQFGDDQINIMQREVAMVLDDYDGYTKIIPKWFIR